MADDISFGRWLQQRRKAFALTQDQLGICAGCAGGTIRKFEAEERHPSHEIAVRLATCLHLPAEEHANFLRFARGESSRSPDQRDPGTGSLPWQSTARTNDLPCPDTPFIGRTREVAALSTLLQRPGVRLVTLTGTGGMGKTRLALQVTTDHLAAYTDGVYFVGLSTVTDATEVVPAISQVLGVKATAGKTLVDSLISALRTKHLLLVLDNFEQVLPAGALIIADLLVAPALTILVTSRVALHLAAEYEYPVPALTLPERQRLPTLAALSQYEAVALFIDRSQAVRPDFALTLASAPAVAEICHRLDGLPLAIELAAARSKILSPQAMLARLTNRLALLSGGARDHPARHQTLRATIDWSYALLDTREQTLFRRVAVFLGGWSLEGAERVCPVAGDLEGYVLDGLQSLVDKSLVQCADDPTGARRFFLLETIHEYALEQLEASGEGAMLRNAHATYYLTMAEQAEPGMIGPEQGLWLARLEADHDNLRAALAWSFRTEGTPQDAEMGSRLASALWWFWQAHGHVSEGRRWLDMALLSQPAPTSLRELLLHHAGVLAREQYDYPRAHALAEESLAVALAQGDQLRIASALLALGRYSMDPSENGRAIVWLEESLTLFHTLNFPYGSAWALAVLGHRRYVRTELAEAVAQLTESHRLFEAIGDAYGIAYTCTQLGQVAQLQGEYERAIVLFEESLKRFAALGEQRGASFARMLLGWTALDQGRVEDAQSLLADSLVTFRELKEESGTAWALVHLGQLALQEGNLAQAEALLTESMALFRALQQLQGLGWAFAYRGQLALMQSDLRQAKGCLDESLSFFEMVGAQARLATVLEHMAVVVAHQGDEARAARLFSATARLRETVGTPQPFAGRAEYNQAVAMLRRNLGTREFEAIWAAARVLPLEQVLAEAREPLMTLELTRVV